MSSTETRASLPAAADQISLRNFPQAIGDRPEDLRDWQVAGHLHAGLEPEWRERRERGLEGAA